MTPGMTGSNQHFETPRVKGLAALRVQEFCYIEVFLLSLLILPLIAGSQTRLWDQPNYPAGAEHPYREPQVTGWRPLKGSVLAMFSNSLFSESRLEEDNSVDSKRIVVLTFDDAVKSHRTFVAPLLKELGFGATFFVTHRWMDDSANFMTWSEIAEIHQMGFEIGNHSWTHDDFSKPPNAARLPEELHQVEAALAKVNVPRPVSFAYCGDNFGPEAVASLAKAGYKYARRGMQPEVPYGEIRVGPVYDPHKNHPLLIPTTGDAYPGWTLQDFEKVVNLAGRGRIAVLQFHGVPDPTHPWVNTRPELFRQCMTYLKANRFCVIALRDIERYYPDIVPPDDPLLKARFP